MSKVFITHPNHGVYLFTLLGRRWWSKEPASGVRDVRLFDSPTHAREFINSHDDQYGFVPVNVKSDFIPLDTALTIMKESFVE